MSDDFGFAPPPFRAADALVQLRRALRDLKLGERGDAYELRGRRIAELALDGEAIRVRLARRPMLTPEWDTLRVASADEQRKLLAELRRRLERWEREE